MPDSNAIIARRGAKRSRQRSRLLALMPPWLRNRVRHTFTGLWDLEIARKAAQIYPLLGLRASRQEHRGEDRNRTRESVFCTCLLIRNCACVNVCARVCLCVWMCASARKHVCVTSSFFVLMSSKYRFPLLHCRRPLLHIARKKYCHARLCLKQVGCCRRCHSLVLLPSLTFSPIIPIPTSPIQRFPTCTTSLPSLQGVSIIVLVNPTSLALPDTTAPPPLPQSFSFFHPKYHSYVLGC